MKMSECRSCGEQIIWTVTSTGKKMPVDADTSSEGTFRLEESGDQMDVVAVFAKKGSEPELHVSHFATCPDRSSWRKS